jgi:cell fate (sporulation/competence/biofilm development) regulator YmcA (YheA/YmcA/DUF963 family)
MNRGYRSMIDRNELWAQAEELAELIAQCPEIAAYRAAEGKLSVNLEAQALIRRLRELNDEIGDFQARRVPEAYYQHLVQESESILEKLEKIPDVVEFQAAQAAVNELLTQVTGRLAEAVTTRVSEMKPCGPDC